jgi:hypothetical protein
MGDGLRTLVVLAAAATLLSCTSAPGRPASAPRLTSPSPVASSPADSKAADFRTRLDLLLGEQVVLVAKEASAASRADEYKSYLRLLASNGDDLTELVRSALGDTAATRFGQIWSAQNDDLVNYTIGLLTHIKSKSDGAWSGLATKFVPQFSQFLTSATEVPLDPIQQLASEHIFEMRAMLDDQIAQNYPKMYADLRTVYAQASGIGDALTPRIAQKFPDKFPGNASSPAVDLRVTLNELLQEHVYLATMTTSAATGGRSSDQGAAARALAANAGALGKLFRGLFGASTETRFDQILAAKNLAMIGYASASTATAKQSALGQLNNVFVTQFAAFVQDSTGLTSGSPHPAIQAQVEATIAVIDDQRSRSSARLGPDDRSADASMQGIADLVTNAIVAKLPTRFSP